MDAMFILFLLPIFFMLHELEEIIGVQKNRRSLVILSVKSFVMVVHM